MSVYREAQRKQIELNLNLLSVFRSAHSNDYQSVVDEMRSKISSIEMGEKESIRQTWADLKKRGA